MSEDLEKPEKEDKDATHFHTSVCRMTIFHSSHKSLKHLERSGNLGYISRCIHSQHLLRLSKTDLHDEGLSVDYNQQLSKKI